MTLTEFFVAGLVFLSPAYANTPNLNDGKLKKDLDALKLFREEKL